MKRYRYLVFAASIALVACAGKTATDRADKIVRINNIVDLTHTLTSDFPFIPVKKLTYPFELIPMATLAENGVQANSWKIHEHLGTHADAPNHFITNQKSLDQIELRDLIVPVVVMHIEERAEQNSDAEISVDDLLRFE